MSTHNSEPSNNTLYASIALGVAALAALGAWYMSLPPSPLPLDAPEDQFSAYRAFQHNKQMAQKPHPANSEENERVREYIMDQLEAMDVEHEFYLNVSAHEHSIDFRRAVLARIPGTDSTKSFAMDAHYDSTPYGPGAADDLCPISAMLETARALKCAPPLKNDIVFVFADAEECGGGGGAGAFVEHPWFKDVGVMLGLEARGTSGPALMFETTQENGWVIRELAKASADAYPRATSVMFDFYDRMPFGSDFSRYKRILPTDEHKGAGLNVAFIDDFCYYHTELDNTENLNLASMQHEGQYCLGLARHFGNIEMDDCRAPNATYFNTIGSHMIVYPQSWSVPFVFLVTLLVLAVLMVGVLRKKLTIGGILAGFGLNMAAMVISALLVLPLTGIPFVFGGILWGTLRELGWYQNDLYIWSFTCIAIGVVLLLLGLVRGKIRSENLLAGALVFWLLSTFFMQWQVPGGTYATLWPLAFMSIGLTVLYSLKKADDASPGLVACCTIFALPAIVLLAPAYVMFGYTLTYLAGAVIASLVAFLVFTLAPQINLIPYRTRLFLPPAFFVIGLLVFGIAYLNNGPSPSCPRLDCLSVAHDFDKNEAWYISTDKELDEYTSQFFESMSQTGTVEEFTGSDMECLKAPAPLDMVEHTTFEIREDTLQEGRRKTTLFLDSHKESQEIWLKLTGDNTVHSVKVAGRELKGGKKDWGMFVRNILHEGIEIELETDPGKPLEILVQEQCETLCDLPPHTKPRPAHIVSDTNRTVDRRRPFRSNHTFSRCTYDFGSGPDEAI